MLNFQKKDLLSFVLAASLALPGCGAKVDCDVSNRHFHKFHKDVPGSNGIDTYLDGEYSSIWDYERTDDYVELTKRDEEVYHLLEYLMNGEKNFDYLYHMMASNKDFFKFHYEYDTVESYTVEDSEGNKKTEWKKVHHEGWHRNPNSSDNTGRVRLYHYRYFAYRVVLNSNGKFTLDRSPAVDDIRDVLDDYPYASEECFELVYEQYRFPRQKLPYLDVNDFDVFQGPNLDQKTYIKK